jgi:FkbM family methyltransferase
MPGRFRRAARSVRRFGWRGATELLAARQLRGHTPWSSPSTLRLRSHGRRPCHFRHRSSDASVITDVLVDDAYACLLGVPDVRVVVDAGANIGATSVFLLEAYPDATLIALEPDPGSFEVLQRNLAHHGSRAHAMRAALWDEPAALAIDRGKFRDGRAWTFQVRQSTGGDVDVDSVTIPGILEAFHVPEIDILKIDIERAERIVFQENARAWLGRVRVIAIELHDPECENAFHRAVAPFRAEVTRVRDLTVWRRLPSR